MPGLTADTIADGEKQPKRFMRVYFVCTWFPSRVSPGEGFFMKHYTDAISAYDDVTVFYTTPDPKMEAAIEEIDGNNNKVKTRIIYFRPYASSYKWLNQIVNEWRKIKHISRAIRKECKTTGDPDVFHLSVMSPLVLILWYYKFFRGIPFLYSEHWDIPIRVHLGVVKKWLPYRIGMKLTALFTERVIVCSQAMKDTFEQYNLSHRVDIISSVVYLNNKNIDDNLRLQGKKIMLHVSSLGESQKNVSGIIKAIAEVAKDRSDFELHILGYGSEYNNLNALAESLGVLHKAVIFHGFVSDEEKRQWFERSLFHILFSNFEGYSLVTAESIYYGRPVIATHCGGPEDFVNERNGILVQPRDIEGLSSGINYMLDNYKKFIPDELRRYGEGIFSPEVVGRKHHELYVEVTGKE
jgi:glycosyltransferase involved in cell wall biosynthesis